MPALRNGGIPQRRLQCQDSEWYRELQAWCLLPDNSKDQKKCLTVKLGYQVLSTYRKQLHALLQQCNPERGDIAHTSPPNEGANGDSSLLLSVTGQLPNQPSVKGAGREAQRAGVNRRVWFPPERQVKQPQSHQEVQTFLESGIQGSAPPIPCSASLEDLLRTKSVIELRKMCSEKSIPHAQLNRLRMAKSILFHDAAALAADGRNSRGRAEGGDQKVWSSSCAGLHAAVP